MRELTQEDSKKRSIATRFVKSNLREYGFLGVILCLLVCSVFLLLKHRNFGYDQYGNLVVALMLLFVHTESHFTKIGLPNRVMKTIVRIWMAFAFAYVFWVLIVQFT